MNIEPIAFIATDYKQKFGIPRQSNYVASARGVVKFVPQYRNPDAVRGLKDFSYIWLIWEFSQVKSPAGKSWLPVVRPPRIAGQKVGVFATRSPNRPNRLGISSVKLEEVLLDKPDSPLLVVSGVDILDGTPIYDIKPYVPNDMHVLSRQGFLENHPIKYLEVLDTNNLLSAAFSEVEVLTIIESLRMDPRPHYHEDAKRVYGFLFAGKNVKFRVEREQLFILAVEE